MGIFKLLIFSLGQLTPFFVQKSKALLTTQEDFRLLRVPKERGRKGSGELVNAFVIIMAILTIMLVAVATFMAFGMKREKIIFEEVEIMRAKNTFYLTNRSLGMTWFISTAQTIFRAENGIGEEYWYQANPAKPKSILLPDLSRCNSANPRICLPRTSDIAAFLKSQMTGYLIIKNSLKLNDVKVEIKDIDIDKPDNFWLSYDRVTSLVTQRLTAEFGATKSDSITNSNNPIATQFRKMVSGGWLLVDFAVRFSKDSGEGKHDYPATTKDNYNHEKYLAEKSKYIDSELKKIRQWLMPDALLEQKKSSELLVPESGKTDGYLKSQSGLLLHYDITARITETAPGIRTGTCAPSAAYDDVVKKAVDAKGWEYSCILWSCKLSYSKDEITAVVKGIINQESSFDFKAVSPCGAAGLMQLMPRTAAGYKVSPIFENSDLDKCDNNYAARLSVAIEGKSDADIQSIDKRFSPADNLMAGVTYLDDMIKKYYEKGDKWNVLALALAAYNCGSGCVDEALNKAKSDSFSVVRQYLPLETRNYVPAVLGCYGYYYGGGTIKASSCDDPAEILLYVDRQTALSRGYVPGDLISVGNQQVRSVISSDLNAMTDAAKKDGIVLAIVSAYRSYEYQINLFESAVQEEIKKGYSREQAEERANTHTARAGHSEHQLGTTIDFNSVEDSFWQTPEGQKIKSWLMQHAEEYGFVLSYPEGKQPVTGYQYEPWHYRYAGRKIAQELKDLGYLDRSNEWTLNKYLRERCRIFIWPLTASTKITSCYAASDVEGRLGPHTGIDIADSLTFPDGDTVLAIADGDVVDIKNDCRVGDTGCGNRYGNYILIKHNIGGKEYYSFYAHLNEVLVEEGKYVGQKNVIGRVGNTGFSEGPHLHLEIRQSQDSGFLNPCNSVDCQGQCKADEIDFSQLPGFIPPFTGVNIYYKHDEANNVFEKKPFSLNVKAEDYLPVLDCSKTTGQYNWLTEKDMLCYGNLYTCTRSIQGLQSSNIKSDRETVGSAPNQYKCMVDISTKFCKQGDDTRTAEECCTNWPDSRDGTFCKNKGFCAGDELCDSDKGEACGSTDCNIEKPDCRGSCCIATGPEGQCLACEENYPVCPATDRCSSVKWRCLCSPPSC